jgi:IMP dehydrogenase
MDRWLTYDQISLIPTKISSLEHRAEADTSVQFGPVKLQVPIIAAPMPDVCDGWMAEELQRVGALGIIHRFQPLEQQAKHFYETGAGPMLAWGAAVSLKDYEASVERIYNNFGRIFCVDTANGASAMVERAVKTLKDRYPDIFIITGNVASREAFYTLESWGVDAIRVGIGSGSVCTTREATGVYSPMASLIRNIHHPFVDQSLGWSYAPHYYDYGRSGQTSWTISQLVNTPTPRKALIIADGGIKTPGDMCKALALGADVVMLGGALAGADEAPGGVNINGTKDLRGAASFSVQTQAGNKEVTYVEGAEKTVPYTGPVANTINRYAAGLRSSMSYMNARTLAEYRANVKVVEIG